MTLIHEVMKNSEELIRLEAFQYLYDSIKCDILENDPQWFNEPEHNDKSDYERGVRATLRLIRHRIDYIID